MSDWAENLDLDLYQAIGEVKPEAMTDSEDGADRHLDMPLDWDNESFSWDTLNKDLFCGVLPLPIEDYSNLNDGDLSSPEDAPSPSEVFAPTSIVASSLHTELMNKYGLSDEQLSDMTLKQLKKRCVLHEQDYGTLKGYRRTCLNRNYARSSRNKQQEKTHSLSADLREAEEKIRRLKADVEEKDLRIQYLELENRLLLDYKNN